ncbi:MAG: hypothetical protein K0R18_40 [Bacillales bacterium]|jgi:hypothetical protein|nr:hypothetical protein [Bacillales bacterium]
MEVKTLKRLIKKAFGKTLYHGTSYEGLLGIIQMGGIYPNEQKNNGAGPAGADPILFDGFTFLATTIDRAKTYANWAKGEGPKVVLEVDVSEDALQPDDNDAPFAKTWQDSSNHNDQVKLLGIVTTDYIKKVYLYNPYTMKEVTETTIDKAEQVYAEKKSLFEKEEDAYIKEKPKKSTHEDFYNKLKYAGYIFDSTGLIINQSIANYANICGEYGAPIYSNRGSITNGDVSIVVKFMHVISPSGIDINYNAESNELSIYDTTVNKLMDYFSQYPNTIENIKTVFNSSILCLFDSADEIPFSDLEMQYNTEQQNNSGQQQTAKRLVKKKVVN